MRTNRYSIVKKVLIFSVILILMIASLIGLVTYKYIKKINFIGNKENNVVDLNTQQSEQEAEETSIIPELSKGNLNSSSDEGESSENDITDLEDELRRNMEQNSTPIKSDDVLNIMLIGSDRRKVGDVGRADTIVLVSINQKLKTITVSSFLRDIYLQIPNKKNNRLNAAYAFGGSNLLMDTVEKNFKIEVDRYVSIDFNAFIKMIDIMEGIYIEISAEEIKNVNQNIRNYNKFINQMPEEDKITEIGNQLLNGKQVLAYVRNRNNGNSDMDRVLRQRRALEQIFIKVKNLKLKQMKKLLDYILPQITTNLTEGEVFSLALSTPSYANYDISQLSIPVAGTYTPVVIAGMDVLGIDFEANIKELHGKIYFKQ